MSNFESRGKERSSSNLELHLNGNRKIGRIKKLEEVTQASGEDLFNGCHKCRTKTVATAGKARQPFQRLSKSALRDIKPISIACPPMLPNVFQDHRIQSS